MTGAWEPEVDDIAAMRRENGGRDLREFMRQQIATGRARRNQQPNKPTAPQVPGHRPGRGHLTPSHRARHRLAHPPNGSGPWTTTATTCAAKS